MLTADERQRMAATTTEKTVEGIVTAEALRKHQRFDRGPKQTIIPTVQPLGRQVPLLSVEVNADTDHIWIETTMASVASKHPLER